MQNSRKAGITSAMASTTLGNEELVGFLTFFIDFTTLNGCCQTHMSPLCVFRRKVTFIKRPCRLSSTPSLPPLHTTLRCGQPPPPHTATNVRGYFGVSPDKACAALSVGSNATRSARIFLMPTVCRVSSVELHRLIKVLN